MAVLNKKSMCLDVHQWDNNLSHIKDLILHQITIIASALLTMPSSSVFGRKFPSLETLFEEVEGFPLWKLGKLFLK